jgi:alpha-galactosidase
VDIYLKDVEDGSKVVGFFNRGPQVETAGFDKLRRVGMPGTLRARDLWSQKSLSNVNGVIQATINPHGAVLIKLTPTE